MDRPDRPRRIHHRRLTAADTLSMASIETPFPVDGTITPTETGFQIDVPCSLAWLIHADAGEYTNVMDQAAEAAAATFGTDNPVRVRFVADAAGDQCGGYELRGLAAGGSGDG